MEESELIQLEVLLKKLESDLGNNRMTVSPSYYHDGCHIALFNQNGELVEDATQHDLKSAYKLIKERLTD